jgi:hypothetical protein
MGQAPHDRRYLRKTVILQKQLCDRGRQLQEGGPRSPLIAHEMDLMHNKRMVKMIDGGGCPDDDKYAQ